MKLEFMGDENDDVAMNMACYNKLMILLDRVTKIYPGDKMPALDAVSLHVEPKEFMFLVGKSGAGKSTLIKLLTREETQSRGKVIVGGIDYDDLRRRHIPHLRQRIGVVFQDFKLLPHRTVYENVAFALEIAGVSGREIRRTVPRVLELVGLADKSHKFPDNLSGGEKQRVAIARSVARQPKILVADEPTGNLDPVTSWEIVQLLEQINNFGTTILVTTHDESIVNVLKKRVVTMKDGKIVEDQKKGGKYELDKKEEAHPADGKVDGGKRGSSKGVGARLRSKMRLDSRSELRQKASLMKKATKKV